MASKSKAFDIIKKIAPIVFAGLIAAYEAFGAQKEAERVDELENRIKVLEEENKEGES